MRARILPTFAVVMSVLTVASQFASQGIATPQDSHGQRYALLIGVNDYSAPFPDLKYCHNDMAALRDSLVKGGFQSENIFYLYEKAEKSEYLPSKSNIVKQLELRLSLANEEDLVLVAFSGHGLLENDVSYLCPCDANPEKVGETCISLDQLFDRMKTCRARNKILVVDACRKELPLAGIRGRANVRGFSDELLAPPPDVQFLASCEARQWSAEDDQLKRGVFSYYVTQGLEGKADQEEQGNHDGAVTLDELYAYAHQKTKLHVANSLGILQRPSIRREGGGIVVITHSDQSVRVTRDINHSGTTGLDSKPPTRPREPSPGSSLGDTILNKIGMKMVLVRAGEFLMGSPVEERDRQPNESPQHRVQITRPFYMGAFEVTQSEYEAIMSNNPSRFKGASLPVESVSWDDAAGFCRRLSTLEGRTYRLPTEAEWEYACRADTKTAFSFGVTVSAVTDANYDGRHIYFGGARGPFLDKTAPVGGYRANRWGLFDMHGNVWEWCSDRYSENYYEESSNADPAGPPTGRFRVIRGGAYAYPPDACRSAARGFNPADFRDAGLGFRVVAMLSE